jgi:SAM-dependent methyltransferase
MRFDIDRLEAFYVSPIGRLARESMARRIAAIWPSASGLDLAGFGHADPLLGPFRASARRVVSISPQLQGAVRWPADAKSAAVLAEDERLPFPDSLFDRIVICHGLEEAERPNRLLREIWRIAAPEARILVIVANRRGLWARTESTPFGQGRPYTRSQVYRLLEDAMFQPTALARALHAPPVNLGVVTAAGEAWERIGNFTWGPFGGVLMVEAVKRVLIDPSGGARGKVRRTVRATAPKAARET